ncbi:hypothetical protein LUZ60_012723 [Juncus effusus]|nr:hypothetical protein LUZ60_012723 [Juncus effusus]
MEKEKEINSSKYEEDEIRRGPWTLEEDKLLIQYISCNGEGHWNLLARKSGLKRTGKSCRLRWLNYLKPDVKRGNLSPDEQFLIHELHSRWGNRWSRIAQFLPGRTDNEIKNYWRTRVQKHERLLNPIDVFNIGSSSYPWNWCMDPHPNTVSSMDTNESTYFPHEFPSETNMQCTSDEILRNDINGLGFVNGSFNGHTMDHIGLGHGGSGVEDLSTISELFGYSLSSNDGVNNVGDGFVNGNSLWRDELWHGL